MRNREEPLLLGCIAFFCIIIDMTETEKNAIVQILTPILESDRIELVDIETHGKALRLLVHKQDGLSLADCQSVNETVRPILEVHQHLANYTALEVASPGIDRPLRTAKDFQRNAGRTVEIDIDPEDGERIQLQGTILTVDPETLVLTQTDGKNVTVSISQILEARLHLKW